MEVDPARNGLMLLHPFKTRFLQCPVGGRIERIRFRYLFAGCPTPYMQMHVSFLIKYDLIDAGMPDGSIIHEPQQVEELPAL
jgi:hypothetical protein